MLCFKGNGYGNDCIKKECCDDQNKDCFGYDLMSRYNQLKLAINQGNYRIAILNKDFETLWVSESLEKDYKKRLKTDTSFLIEKYILEFTQEYKLSVKSVLNSDSSWNARLSLNGSDHLEKIDIKMMVSDTEDPLSEILVSFENITEVNPSKDTLEGNMKSFTHLKEDVESLSPLVHFDTNVHLVILTLKNISDISFIKGEVHVDKIFNEFVKMISPRFAHSTNFYRVSKFELGILVKTKLNAEDVLIRTRHFIGFGDTEVDVDGDIYRLKVHGGISTLEPKQNFDSLIRNAAFAKDLASHDDTTLELYTLENVIRHIEDITLSQRLQTAIYTDELHIEYQAIVTTKGSIWGYEALIRWKEKNYGDISAFKIIEFAKRSGSSVRLGYWIIKRVFKDIQSIQKQHKQQFIVSINLSIEHLTDPNFAKNVYDLSRNHGIQTDCIMFEITESESFSNMSLIINVLDDLKNYGFLIGLDDFGVGYSTFKNLIDLPLNVLKLDKSLISSSNIKSLVVCKSIVDLAKDLNLKIIAEGVETQSHRALIEELNVDLCQGFFYYKPMVLEKLLEVLIESKCQ